MSEPHFRSATALAAAIRTREIGCRQLLERYLSRVERHNPALNAMIATDLDRARQRADGADAALGPRRELGCASRPADGHRQLSGPSLLAPTDRGE